MLLKKVSASQVNQEQEPISTNTHSTESSPTDGSTKAFGLSNEFAELGLEFSKPIDISPLEEPALAHWNKDAAKLIDWNNAPEKLISEFTQAINGEGKLPASAVASLYAGHQFGSWNPQLGDGRAAVLGQINHPENGTWELQTKGSGPTPYSRGSDGRAVLRSSIREYLCSEAMHGLGIGSSRALCLLDSKTIVRREEIETGALIVRMAPTHIRFGSFEIFASRKQTEQVKQLADFVIDGFYPECRNQEKPYLAFYEQVIERTALMIAHWQAQGFSHGVMNTDNMSILGLTIDYGPFGFMEGYDPSYICNHSDHTGRYAFDQQPQIGLWNLACLGNALLSLIELDDAQKAMDLFSRFYFQNYYQLMFKKLGISEFTDEDRPILTDLLSLMTDTRADYSRCFRLLSREETHKDFLKEFNSANNVSRWLDSYRERVAELDNCEATMLSINPKYILRNYIAQIAINQAKQGDYSEIDRLVRILHSPFDEHPDAEEYFATPPSWAKNLSLSCSS